MTAAGLRRLLNLYPPLLFAGVRVERVDDDFRYARVRLKLRWYNRNYVRTQFGGSLFSMTDPFWMIMVLENLGRDYVVWDKAATIDFVAPGRSDVIAEFRLDAAVLDELRAAAAGGEKVLRWFEVDVTSPAGDVVARVRKQVYVRRKRDAGASASA
ncbi:DUF4442 domain-containing protein [Chiayiivirga flava]|uniref:Acyl-coenzyme A thioesterase PaaI-like protein n=1 Tax=Chiayiivirga flava TaxID=659595 RepID=A0A7W8D7U8_9GAMM|nr:DUF4442 domain-containing protein [Chiayiivirga flava]MBB5209503.1 acyl-coenzyme A thioesterase PaaI-like protein [Chiayiivirga flava]